MCRYCRTNTLLQILSFCLDLQVAVESLWASGLCWALDLNSRSYLVNPGARQEIIPASSFKLSPEPLEPWKPVSSSFSQFVEIDSAMMKPLLMDVHETAPGSLVLSFGIADKFARQDKVMEFLLSRSEEFKEKGFDMSLLNELMELDAMRSSCQLRPYDTSSVLYLNQELGKPVLDLVRDMVDNPEFSVRSNGHVLFSSNSNPELNDLLSIASEFNLSRNSTKWRQLSPLIPHFQRFESEVLAPVNLKAVTVLAPLKSPEKTRVKSPRKQNTKRKAKERDLYKRNHLHAYESLLSLMIGNDHQHKHATVVSLQKSCGELSELLTQFSISVAGTGIAVLFSVACSLASRRVPFCANKFFDTGLGFSLVILAWAVNRLREVIVHANRKANKPCSSLKDDEIINSVEKSIKEVYFRAATVIAVFALRFAC
ncbi:PREDICTED: uncharacterized protein LOC104737458 isoform X4 [Camelina sativa]|uniref:Uncharacterized protein LOC104737458 isoform X4 n=1 Tax=Camelina sativa TaxID=90675 RepID=A0ABM0VGV0_CAMSA|nr:PREDICTED: uncharacterized protein LOC104737458 isoform X4 [Camelina sativa]